MDNFTISCMDKYLDQIFKLQKEISAKEFKIINLELELSIKQQMIEAFNRCTVKEEQYEH